MKESIFVLVKPELDIANQFLLIICMCFSNYISQIQHLSAFSFFKEFLHAMICKSLNAFYEKPRLEVGGWSSKGCKFIINPRKNSNRIEMGPHSHIKTISPSEGHTARQTYQFRKYGVDSASLDLRYLITTKIM